MVGPENLPEDKRQRIVEAALNEFAGRGFDMASTNTITEQARISKGLLFHYFGSKEGLYLYLVKHCLKVAVERAKRAAAAEPQSPDMLERLIGSSLRKLQLVKDEPVLMKFLFEALAKPPPKLAKAIMEAAEEYRPAAADQISRDIDTSLLRPGVTLAQAMEMVMIFGEGMRSLYAEAMIQSYEAAEKILSRRQQYIDLLKYGLYKRPGDDVEGEDKSEPGKTKPGTIKPED
jgi:AcrR family transcriptional regulator